VAYQPEDHYWFERPIAPGGTNVVSRFYAYGSTYRGRYQVHHGVEFENPTGTPVLAVGPGQVVVAGLDNPQVYGLFSDFYGRLVVIKHDRTWHGQPVFTLYGHLSKVRVEVGQPVEAGQIIGEVGAAGIALGPHLHLEVRVGQNTYDATRDPELWIKPFKGYGTIAGRLLDADGNSIPGALISLYNDQNNWRGDAETYGEGANPDDDWRENFVFGNVPAGHYTVQYVLGGNVYETTVDVEAGKTALVILPVS
jgi:murein DD-endopeptidase MepM/ murein hydrolase activator NlpD